VEDHQNSPKIAFQIRRELAANKHGWTTTKQVEDLIFKKGGGGRRIKYHYTHMYRLLHKWGFKLKVPRKAILTQLQTKRKTSLKKKSRDLR
jgi:putative transposase